MTMNKIGTAIANFFSFLLNPLFIPFYSIVLLFVYTNFFNLYTGQVIRFLLPVFTFTCLLPAMFIFILRKLSYIGSLSLESPKDRIFPFIIFIFADLSLVYFFYTAGLYLWFVGLILAPAIIALIGLLINFFWKISVHTLGIGGLIGGVFSICFNVKATDPYLLFIVLFVLSGLLGVSRLYLRRSTPAQIYIGFVLGFVIAYLTVFLSMYSLSFLFV